VRKRKGKKKLSGKIRKRKIANNTRKRKKRNKNYKKKLKEKKRKKERREKQDWKSLSDSFFIIKKIEQPTILVTNLYLFN